MSHSYKYAIAQLHSNPVRGEKLNLAIVVFNPDGLQIHSARNLEKVRVISAALGRNVIEQALQNLQETDSHLLTDGQIEIEDRIKALSSLSALNFSPIGQFFASTADSYFTTVNRLLLQLVEPEPAARTSKPEKKTKLLTSIKSAFRSEKVLARKGEGLESHRIVVNEQLAEGLNADLLLRNGAMHVVQTVDASHSDHARRAIQEIGISALVFEQARIQFGGNCTRPRLVYAACASMENSISPALHAAEHQGANLINWESRDDRTRFIVDMSSLAEPVEEQKRASFGAIHASSTARRSLN